VTPVGRASQGSGGFDCANGAARAIEAMAGMFLKSTIEETYV
jgi:hypothetical protein